MSGPLRRQYHRCAVDQHQKYSEEDLMRLLQGAAGPLSALSLTGGVTGASSQQTQNLFCSFCNVRCNSQHDIDAHLNGKRHRVKCLLHALNNKMRGKLVADKDGITVTSKYDSQKEKGDIKFDVEQKKETTITITVQNTSEDDILYLRGCELLKPLLRQFKLQYPDKQHISRTHVSITPGGRYEVTVKVTLRQFGHRSVPLAFLFTKADPTHNIHIVRFLRVQCVNDIMKDLAATSRYVKPSRIVVGNISSNIEDGLPLTDLPGCMKLEMDVTLKKYWIPEHVRKLINSGLEQYKGITKAAEQVRSLLQNDCVRESTHQKLFQNLLWVEEAQMEVDIRHYDMEQVTMKVCKENKRWLMLEVPGLAEKRPSVLKGDCLFVRILLSPEDIEYKGYVHEVREKELCLGFSNKLMQKHVTGMKFSVRFTFSRLPLCLQHRALHLAQENALNKLLFPTPSTICSEGTIVPLTTKLTLYDSQLQSNPPQLTAVKHILAGSSRPAPYVIFGPPGTGKTVTVVEAIKQVAKHLPTAHILACAPSNAAADLITSRLINHLEKRDVYRLNAVSRVYSNIPENIQSISNWNKQERCFEFPSKKDLQKYKVIVCTLVTAGRLASAKFPETHFTHIFIDESGHAVEPEALIPIAGILECGLNPDGGQVVLAGDPKQLGPVLRSPIAIKCGLDISLLERLMTSDVYMTGTNQSYDSRLVTKLLHNYRSHPDILHLPNTMFYANELIAKADIMAREAMCQWEWLPRKGFPLLFHGVVGKDEREERSPSFFNTAEAATVVDYIEKLLTCKSPKVTESHIGVIAPYRRQVQKLRKAFEKKRWKKVTVGSTEEFQGQERKIIIISTVRSRPEYVEKDIKFNLGFLINPKRFNVSITRAKALLVVIGNPYYLARDEHWGQLLDFCIENKAYTGVEYTESDSEAANWDEELKKISGLHLHTALDDEEAETVPERVQVYSKSFPEAPWRTEDRV